MALPRRSRRPVVEELEPRILYSADLAPALDPGTLAPEAEVRTLDAGGEFDSATAAATQSPDLAAPDSAAQADQDHIAASQSGRVDVAAAPLAFERNVGQTDAQVDFLGRGSGYTVWLSDGDAVLALQNGDSTNVVRLDLVGGNVDAAARGEGQQGADTNYLIGDQTSWHTQVQSFGAVLYDEVYAGVDLRYYGNGHQLEYDFIVAAGADASNIRLRFDGVQAVGIDEHGNLVLTLDADGHTLAFQTPVSYQEGAGGREAVSSRYVVLDDGSVGFDVGSYDHSRALVIDPVLAYGTYLGGSGGEQIWNMETDADGNVYVTGYTNSVDFPTTTGTLFGSPGSQDAFVTKFSPDLSTRLYSTYIGGSGTENAFGIAVDSAGNAYVVGATTSTDFPLVAAFDSTLNNGQDAFIVKLNATGTALVYSTLLGGNGSLDTAYGVAVDSAGNAYVGGYTDSSSGFPLTAGALDAGYANGEAFVTKLDAAGSAVLYSTYFGGGGDETIYNLAVDAAGNVAVVGESTSVSFPFALPGAYQGSNGSTGNKYDAFVAKLNTTGTGLLYGSFIGGNQDDNGYAIALDSAGRLYIAGDANSNNFDVTVGALQTARGGAADGFAAIFDPSQPGVASLVYSTFIGGSGTESFWGIDVDAGGHVYLAGHTTSTNLAATPDAHQVSKGGGEDIYVVALDPSIAGAGGRIYASYLGGGNAEDVWAARFANGKFYVAGNAASASGITTAGAFDETFNGGFDGYVAAFAFEFPPVLGGGAALAYNETSGPVALVPTLTVSDSDSATLEGATVSITANYNSAEDVLAFNNTNPWGITGVWTAATGTLTLSGTSSVANYQAALRSVTYQNTSEKPSTLTRSVTLVVTDGALISAPVAVQVAVASLNDAPVNDLPGGQTIGEDSALVFSAGNSNAITLSDADAGAASLQVTLTASNGRLTLAQIAGLSFTTGDGSNDASMTFSGTLADLNAALNGLRFDPNLDFNGSANLQVVTNDLGNTGAGGALSTTGNIGITVTAVNDAPSHAVPGPQATLQNTPLVFSSVGGNAISIADVDAGGGELAVNLTATQGTLDLGSTAGLSLVSGNGSASVTVQGTLTALNAALNGLRFTPTAGYTGPASLVIATSDQANTGAGGPGTESDVIAITVSPNVAPTLTTTAAPLVYSEGAGAVVLDAGLTVSDPDSGSVSYAVLHIQSGYVSGEDKLLFTNQLGINGSWDDVTGTLTLAGSASLADYQTALRSVTYLNASENASGTNVVTLVVNDGIADSSLATRTITLVPQNDAPGVTVPGIQSVAEDAALVFSSANGNQITVSDVDAGTGTVRVRLTATNGVLTLLQTTGLSFFSGADGSASMTIDGALNDLNVALSVLRFDPTANYVGAASLQIEVNDLGNSGNGGALNQIRNVAIDVTPVNDAPAGADGTVTMDEDTWHEFSAADFGFADPNDTPGDALRAVRISQLPGGGTLTNAGTPVAAGSFVSAADIAAGQLVYTPFADQNGTGYATLEFQVQDTGGTSGGGVDLDPVVRKLTIDVNAVNDAPNVDAPVGQSTAINTPLVLSADNANGLTVTDIDAAGAALNVSLTATDGTLTLGSTAGLLGLNGNGTAGVTFTATLDAINDALDGLIFTPNAGFAGSTSLQVVVDDLGNSGSSGSLQGSAAVTVDVTYAAPTVVPASGAGLYTEGAAPVAIDPGLTLTGGSLATLTGATVQIGANYANGQDLLTYGSLPSGVLATWNAATGSLIFSGSATLAEYQALLRTVTFEAAGDAPSTATRTITFAVEDGTGSGSADVQMAVAAVDDAPVLTVIADQSIAQGGGTGALAFNLSDPDTPLASLIVSASASNTVLVPTGAIVLGGTGANRTISVTPDASQYGSSTITIDVFDGWSTTSTSFQLSVVPPNSPPVITASSFAVAENSAAGTTVGTVVAIDPDVEESFNRIYYVDALTDSIVRMNLTGGSVTTIVSGLSSPGGVAVDYRAGKVYWTDSGSDAIQRSNLDGSGVQSLFTGLADPVSLKIDSEGGKVYWVEVGAARIRRANLDGTGLEDILTTANGLSDPRALDLDVAGGKLYWVDDGNNTIKRANLDGSGIQTLISAGLSGPNGIALDVAGGKLYWSDSGTGSIGRANLDGSAAQASFLSVGTSIKGLAVDTVRDHVYWTDEDLLNARVRRANLDGTGITTVHVTGLALLSDPMGIALGPATPALAYSIVSGNTAGAFSIDGTSGRLTVANPAALDFDTTPTFTLTVQAQDAGGAVSQQAVTVQLINVNEAPSAIALSSASVAENTNTASGFVLGTLSSTDPDAGDTFIYTVAGGADQAKFSVSGNQLILTDGVLDFEAKSSYDVQVRSTDAGGQSVLQGFTINVTNVNEAPTITAIGPQVILEDTSTAALSFTIADPETPAGSLTITTLSSNPTLVPTANIVIGGSGSSRTVTVTPAANKYGGPVTVTVRVSDGALITQQTFAVAITGVADTPAVTNATTTEDTQTSSGLVILRNAEDGAEVNYFRITGITGGTLYKADGTTVISNDSYILAAEGSAGLKFTPAPNSTAPGSFNVQAATAPSAGGLGGAVVTATIAVTAVNDAPIAIADSYATAENTVLANSVLTNDSDVEGDLLSAVVIDSASNGFLVLNPNGTFTYTPNPGFNGTDSFRYAAFDGTVQSAPVVVSITVNGVNDAPTAIDLTNAAVDENTDTTVGYVVGTLSTTDPEATDTHVYSIAGGADMLRFSIGGSSLMLSDGVLDVETKPLYQVVIRTTDAGGLWFDQAFDITVNDIDEAPTISAPPDQTMTEGAPTLTLPFTVADPESAAGSLIVTATPSDALIVQSGSLILGGSGPNRTIEITPELYAYGTVTITLSVSDGINTTLTAFDLTVTPVADHEVVVDTVSDVADGDTASIDALLMNRGADGYISLREAIEAANNSTNSGPPDRILFDIAGPGPHFIDVLSQLPAITDSVVIDGTSEPDYAGTPIVSVHGDAAGLNGLVLVAGGNTVRGLVIIGFDQSGIVLQGGDNTIAGNYIGIEADGITAHGAGHGIRVLSNGNLIGGTDPGDRNVISGNLIDGLVIEGGSSNVVQGNYIGTDHTGTVAIGNTEDGIWLNNAVGNLIGGTAAGAGNVISGNLWSGIAADGLSQDNVIQGNLIGVDPGGTAALGNQRSGVRIESGTGNVIGGAGSARNVVAYNTQDGVAIVSGTGHSVLENSIHSNGGLGIDLLDNGITLNDMGDADADANLRMNFPVIYSVVVAGGNVTIEGEARAGATVRFYESSDPVTEYGEGRTFVGAAVVSGITPGNVDATARRFSVTFAAGSVAVGDRFTATATDAAGNTSEFARNVVATAVAPGIAVTPVSGLSTTEDGGTASFSVVLLTQPSADVTINLYSSDTTEGFPLVSSLTFTSINWNVAQTVTIGGVPDGVSDGNVAYTIVLDPAQSLDPAYRLLDAVDVSVQNINGINDAPTALNLSNQSEPEGANTTGGLVVGYLSTTDPETFDSHTYSIVGGADAAKFSISGSALSMDDGVLDYERQASYTVTVRTTDIGGLTLDRTFVVSVTNVNDAPTLASNASASVAWGGSVTLGPGNLLAGDVDNSTAQLVYTITGVPSVGSVRLSGAALGINGTFTQADIDSGRVSYAHNGASAGPDAFTFTVSDGSVTLAPMSFNVAVGAAPVIVIVDPVITPPPPTDPGPIDPGSSPPAPADPGGAAPASPGGSSEPGLPAEGPAGPGGGEAFSGGAELLIDAVQAAGAGNAGVQRGTLRVGFMDTAALRSQLLTVSLNTFASTVDGTARDVGESAPTLNDFSLSSLAERSSLATQSVALTTFRATLGDTQWTTELDRMREDIDAQVPTQSALVVSSVAVTGSLSVGYVLWLLRGGLLLSSLLSSLPAWSVIDPMPVLSRTGHDDEDEGDDPLEKLFGRARAALGLKRGLFSRRSKPIDEVVTST